MRRRLTIAIVGTVIAALLLTGAGTIALAAVGNRADAEQDLRLQVETLGDLFAELTIVPSQDGEATVRERLQAVAESISIEGIGLLIVPRNVDPIGELPSGLTIEELDLAAIRRGETISDRSGSLIWAARGITNRAGVPQLLVLTQDADPILLPAFRWFLVAGGATIVIAALIALRLSRSLTDPLLATRAVTSRIADGDLDARIDGNRSGLWRFGASWARAGRRLG